MFHTQQDVTTFLSVSIMRFIYVHIRPSIAMPYPKLKSFTAIICISSSLFNYNLSPLHIRGSQHSNNHSIAQGSSMSSNFSHSPPKYHVIYSKLILLQNQNQNQRAQYKNILIHGKSWKASFSQVPQRFWPSPIFNLYNTSETDIWLYTI